MNNDGSAGIADLLAADRIDQDERTKSERMGVCRRALNRNPLPRRG